MDFQNSPLVVILAILTGLLLVGGLIYVVVSIWSISRYIRRLSTTSKLNQENVERVYQNSLILKAEYPYPEIKAHCLGIPVAFHPERLKSHKQAILDMLGQLPSEFFNPYGSSFLAAYHDFSDRQWADAHWQVNHLVTLGMAIGAITLPIKRETWPELPYGMPYLAVNIDVE